jgi:hypothetical protein
MIMADLSNLVLYKRFRNALIFRLCITVGITLFWTFKTLISNDSFSGDESFLIVFFIFSNLIVACGLIIGFVFASKRKNSYLTGDFKTRLDNFIKSTMYRYSAMEISPVLFMVGFVMFGKIYFVIEAIAFYVLLGIYFPTKKRLSKDLNLEID